MTQTPYFEEYLEIKKIKDQIQVGSVWHSLRKERTYTIKEIDVRGNIVVCECTTTCYLISFNLTVFIQSIKEKFLILQ